MTTLLLGRWTSAVVESARRFGAGDLTARRPVPRGLGELTDVANALNAAAETSNSRQEAQARLLAELVAAEEETRRRIAADIHDDTAQAVAAAGLRIDALAAELEDPARARGRAEARPALMRGEQAAAPAALRAAATRTRRGGPGRRARAVPDRLLRHTTASTGGWTNRLDGEPAPEARAILYRVALEALTNVRKHANASMVEVLLERRGVGVAVRVRDDGAGFDLPEPDAPAEPGHIGLVSMRERAEAAGGRFAMSSDAGRAARPWSSGCRRRTARVASRGCRAASPPPPRPRGPRRRASRRPAGGGSSRWSSRGGAGGRCPVPTCRRP